MRLRHEPRCTRVTQVFRFGGPSATARSTSARERLGWMMSLSRPPWAHGPRLTTPLALRNSYLTLLRITSSTVIYLAREMFDQRKSKARSHHPTRPQVNPPIGISRACVLQTGAGDLPRATSSSRSAKPSMTSLDLHAGACYGYASTVRRVPAPSPAALVMRLHGSAWRSRPLSLRNLPSGS